MSQAIESEPTRTRLNRNGLRMFAGISVYIAVQGAVLFLAAGTLRWINAWAYIGVYLSSMLAGMAWVASVNPAVINERGRRSTNTEPFDRRFHRLMPLIIFSGLIVAGLDFRFGWSAVPPLLQLLGFAGLAVALLTASWVLASNPFASRVVRLQDEQRVISGGPYRFVRHPMYSGTLLAWLAAPLALDSWWMFIPSALGIALFVWRTRREDDTLLAQLSGYAVYAQRVRYRLLPGVW